jgi:integrase/recombinase XerD
MSPEPVRIHAPQFCAPLVTARTVGEIIDLYLQHAKRELSPRTWDDKAQVLGQFREDYGLLLLRDAKPFHLRLWLDGNPAWKSDWSLRRICGDVQRAFNWAEKLGLAASNPFRGVTQRAGEPGQPMEEKHFGMLLRNARPYVRRVLIFLRWTGARPCEMAATEWSFIDFDRGAIILHKHKTARTQKRFKPRIILLHPVVLKLLIWIRRHQPHERFVFTNARRTQWNRSNLSLCMQRLKARAGVPKTVRCYGLRHAFGTRAVVNGIDIKTLAELMGHTTTRQTEHYIHLSGRLDHLQAAVQRAMG